MSITNTKPSNDYPGKLTNSGFNKKGITEGLSFDAGTYWFQTNAATRIFSPSNYATATSRDAGQYVSNVISFLVNETNGTLVTDISLIAPPAGGATNVAAPLVQTNDYLYAAFRPTIALIMRSSDGVNWTAINNPPSVTMASLNSEHKVFVYNADVTEKFVYCAGTISTTNAVWTSTDGLAWTSRSTPVAAASASGPGSVVINANATNKYCLNTGATSNMILYSTDAVTWKQATATTGTSSLLGPVVTNNTASTNEIYIYSINNSTNNILTSTNGVTWTSRSTGRAGTAPGLIWFNNYYIAFANNSTSYEYSTDGITWSAGTLPRAVTVSNTVFPFVFENELYVQDSVNGSFVSTNGTTWTWKPIPSSGQFYKIGNVYISISSATSFNLRTQSYYRLYRLDDAPALP